MSSDKRTPTEGPPEDEGTSAFNEKTSPTMETPERQPTLTEIQQRVDDWISQFEEGYFPPLANMARMTEEVGELARAVSHLDGFKKPKEGEAHGSISEELGDILFVMICLANQLDIDLGASIMGVLDKVDARDRSRWTLKAAAKEAEEH